MGSSSNRRDTQTKKQKKYGSESYEGKKKGFQLKEETLEYAGFVFLATSLGAAYDRKVILSIYQNWWQVELLFKQTRKL